MANRAIYDLMMIIKHRNHEIKSQGRSGDNFYQGIFTVKKDDKT